MILYYFYSPQKKILMANQQKTSKKDSEKILRKTIQEKIATALSEHKNGMSDKDFQDSLKKASKIISKDLAEAAEKKFKKEKKAHKRSKNKKKDLLM